MNLMRRVLLAPAAAVAVVMLLPAAALAGDLSVTPSQLDYGVVAINVSAFQVVTVTDTGPSPVTIQGAELVQGDPLAPFGGMGWDNTCHDVGTSTRTLQPGESCEFDTSWSAGALGSWEGLWEVDTSAGPVDLPVTGFGRGADESHPALVAFDRYVLEPVQKTITIDALGNDDLHISAVGLGDTPSTASSTADYSIVSDTCTGATLPPGQRCAVKVILAGAADADSVLWVHSNAYTDGGYPGHDGVDSVLLDSRSHPALAITKSTVSATRFSPAGRHALPASVVYSFRCTDAGSNTVQVVNGRGHIVKTWSIAGASQAWVRWRGANASGRRVPPGRYTIRVSARFLGHVVTGGAKVVHIPA